MSLEQVRRGIYSLNGFNPDNRIQPVVSVHPFFYDVGHSKNYLDRFESLVRSHGGPLITLEEYGKLESTSARYKNLGRESDTYFIKTKSMFPHPSEIDWEDMFHFLENFRGSPTILTGGKLWGFCGCLGTTAKKLLEYGFDIDIRKDLTFS